MASPIRVVVVDDNPLVRRGIRMMTAAVKDVEVIGEAEDGEEGVALVKTLDPDVVLMDISMPGLDGLAATGRIRSMNGDAQVIIVSMHASPTLVRRALDKGARGYVVKRTAAEELLPAIQRVHDGEFYLSSLLGDQDGGPDVNDLLNDYDS